MIIIINNYFQYVVTSELNVLLAMLLKQISSIGVKFERIQSVLDAKLNVLCVPRIEYAESVDGICDFLRVIECNDSKSKC